MRDFTFVRPDTVEEALAFLHAHAGRCMVCAGGTDLMVALRRDDPRLDGKEYLIDLGALSAFRGVRRDGGTVRIGALTTHDMAAGSPLLPAMLRAAAGSVGAQQTRNIATVGGNVANAAVAADTLPPLAALDARVCLRSHAGERTLPLTAFITGAGRTCILPDELLTAIEFSALDGWESAFAKLGRRRALAISRMSAAVALELRGGVIASARIAAGGVFAIPRRSARAERRVIGQTPSAPLFRQAGEEAAREMVEITGVRWSTEYKLPALAAVVGSALLRAAGMEEDA